MESASIAYAEANIPLWIVPAVIPSMTSKALEKGPCTGPAAAQDDLMLVAMTLGSVHVQDRKKVPAGEPIFSLASADLVSIGRRPYHVAPELPCIR